MQPESVLILLLLLLLQLLLLLLVCCSLQERSAALWCVYTAHRPARPRVFPKTLDRTNAGLYVVGRSQRNVRSMAWLALRWPFIGSSTSK
jgi:hypothetical protein